MLELDHILWACADMSVATAAIGKAASVTPAIGGSHVGFGTHNNLLSLGSGVYFEILALDPGQEMNADCSEIAGILRPRLFSFAVRGGTLEAFTTAATALGLEPSKPTTMTRRRQDGTLLSWECVFIESSEFRNSVPFLIDWGQSEHPSRTTPQGCSLKQFSALHPEPERLRRIYERLSIDVPVLRAPVEGFQAVLSTPNGDVVLT